MIIFLDSAKQTLNIFMYNVESTMYMYVASITDGAIGRQVGNLVS